MKVLDALLEKAKKDQLGHFYLLESRGDKTFEHLMISVQSFIQDYFEKVEGTKGSGHLINHPDVFILGNAPDTEDPEDAFFTVAEAEELNRFFEFKPVQSKRKFAVITEAHRVNSIVANKWLKLLEEPQGAATIFLLNPRGIKLLDTIHSRAQHLRLSMSATDPEASAWQEFLALTKGQTLAQFLELHQKGERSVQDWTQELLRWEAEEYEKSAGKFAIGKWLKNLQDMETFHQPSATKWTLFYSYLQEHVLPRVSH
jgi:hypothetical protein